MPQYGRTTQGASWISFEDLRRGRSITLSGTETATKISAYIRSQGSATNGLRATLYNDSDDVLAYQSDVLAGFTDTTGQWRDFVFTGSVAAGTYWLTVFAEGIAGGANTVQIAYDTVGANASLYESWFNDGSVWPTQTADLTGLEAGSGNTQDISLYLETSTGGTVNTQTLSDTVAVNDAGLDYVFANRLGSENVVVTDAPTEFYSIHNIEAISETVITDEFVAWLRRHRVLDDTILVTDELISSVIGYLIYNSILTSNVSVTDELLKAANFHRLLESNIVSEDQLLRALLVARDLLDGVEVTDSSLTAMQRFILLTDTISLEDSLLSTYVPVNTVNPLIRIGFDQPNVTLGGYSVN